MNAIIIEDEIIAAESLKTLLDEVDSEIKILAVLQSIEESVEWIQTNPSPDIVFMDIHLADGSAFMIFDNVDIRCPIVFTTAYDEYALKAFEVNSIDYLLKPINKPNLEKAIDKYKNFKGESKNNDLIVQLIENIRHKNKTYKNFLIPEKDKLIPLSVDDIYYIYIDTKIVKAITSENKTCYMDKTLDEIMENLDTHEFFRANRQYIISRNAVKDMSIWFGSKLSVNLKIPIPEKIIISKARVRDFKNWLSE